MKGVVIITFLLFLSTAAQANVYRCTTADGETIYQASPCQGAVNESEVKVQTKRTKTEDAWRLIKSFDDLTDKQICVIESPRVFVGSKGSQFHFVSVRVTMTIGDQYLVWLFSDDNSLSRLGPASFHNDISGLGVRVDKHAFISADDKRAQRLLGFSAAKSSLIVSQMREAHNASVRVRFWPYDDTYDGRDISMRGFTNALGLLNECRV